MSTGFIKKLKLRSIVQETDTINFRIKYRSFPSHFYFSSDTLRSNSVKMIMKIKLYLMQYKLIDLMEIIEKIYI